MGCMHPIMSFILPRTEDVKMKAKNLLALLAAAAMLCTAALPTYAEEQPLSAPAAVTQPAQGGNARW